MNGIAQEASRVIPAAGPTAARRAVTGVVLPLLTVVVAAAGAP